MVVLHVEQVRSYMGLCARLMWEAAYYWLLRPLLQAVQCKLLKGYMLHTEWIDGVDVDKPISGVAKARLVAPGILALKTLPRGGGVFQVR